jgi:hypothetical protein
MYMYSCQIPRIGEIWLLIDLPRFHSFLLPLGKFEKIGIFDKKKTSQNSLCIIKYVQSKCKYISGNFPIFWPDGDLPTHAKGSLTEREGGAAWSRASKSVKSVLRVSNRSKSVFDRNSSAYGKPLEWRSCLQTRRVRSRPTVQLLNTSPVSM